MMRKLRALYDRLYVGIDCAVLAHNTAKWTRKKAREAEPKADFDRDFAQKVRPYWRQFNAPMPKKFWYRTYGPASEPVDPRYIPYDIYVKRILPHFNTLLFARALQDKCLHNLLVPDMERPVTVVKNVAGVFCGDDLVPMTREQAIARCRAAGRIIVKPSVGSGGGANIRFYDGGTLTEQEAEDIFRQYKRDFIIQEKLAQHQDLAALNPRSLNTVRITTFFFRGQVHILSALLRIGGGDNEVDNVSQGGYQCTIRPDGSLDSYAITKLGGTWQNVEATAGGVRFAGRSVPNYEAVKDTVCRAAAKMAHFKLVGWDIAVSQAGEPVLVEYNVIPGQSQGTCGPAFGELTDDVLTEVFGRRS